MEVTFRNAHGELSSRDRAYAVKKFGFLNRFLPSASRAEVVHREENHEHVVEVTVFADGQTIRSEEHNLSLRAAIDNASGKLMSRMRRTKDKLTRSKRA